MKYSKDMRTKTTFTREKAIFKEAETTFTRAKATFKELKLFTTYIINNNSSFGVSSNSIFNKT